MASQRPASKRNGIFFVALLGAVTATSVIAGCQNRDSYTLEISNAPAGGTGGGAGGAGGGGGTIPAPVDAAPRFDACLPRHEVCNGLDDDCNGVVDDVPPTELQDNVLSCGRCDNTCLPVPANATATCSRGQCGYTCKEGYVDVDMNKANGCECEITGKEICDGKDNNCDGKVDEGFDLDSDPNHCGACGAKCMIPGAEASCVNRRCMLKTCLPGAYDRNMNPADGCESACGDTNAGVEICDGLDNDCDGKVDELNSEADRTMDDKLVYLPAPLDVTVFAHEASRPDATAMKGGGNSVGRPCSVAGRQPWANVTKEEAAEACKRIGVGWRLCTTQEWVASCTRGMNQAFPYGNQYQPTRCNGADYTAVPETAPTGSLAMCVAEHPNNGQIFDLSGNVREWVLSRVQPESFELRGGAYNVVSFEGDAPGLKCSSAIPAPANVDVRLPSVGFRCCRSGRLPAQ